jgi:hypothetical protein
MENLVPALKAELDKLTAELEENPLFRKIRQIEALLALYEKTESELSVTRTIVISPTVSLNGTQQSSENKPAILQTPPAPGSVRTNSKVAKVRRAIFDYLTLRGPSKRSAILDHLKQKGLMGTEKEPIRVLASYLTTSKDLFENRGAGVWKVADGAAMEDPDAAI